MQVFCTLFDSFYLDKGLTLYNSLDHVSREFVIYILPMDSRCSEVLSKMKLDNAVIINYDEFETDELKLVKMQRNRAEFCWTCTPYLLLYVLRKFKESICTYIDADMFFYKNPQSLLDEIGQCSVGVVEHRFSKSLENKQMEKSNGRFCVEFNTFRNNEEGLCVLEEWKTQCFQCCTSERTKDVFGDQKYLDSWPQKYSGIHIMETPGGGVAPWNIARYKGIDVKNYILKDCMDGKIFDLIFYHFHMVEFIDEHTADIHVFIRNGKKDKELVYAIYSEYLKELYRIRKFLEENYHVKFVSMLPENSKKSLSKKIQENKGRLLFLLWKKVYCLGKRKQDLINCQMLIMEDE